MKCLNPACESVVAEELNVSINVSETAAEAEKVYLGSTEYGDTLLALGTTCGECDTITYVHNWKEMLVTNVGPAPYDVVLPEPRWCALCLEESEKQVHADYCDKYASKWDTSSLLCSEHALKHALRGQPLILWAEAQE